MRCWFVGPAEEVIHMNLLRGSPGLKRGEMEASSNVGKTGERPQDNMITSLPCLAQIYVQRSRMSIGHMLDA